LAGRLPDMPATRRRATLLALLALLAVLLAGCGLLAGPTPTPAAARDCGQEQAGLDGVGNEGGRACLLDAYLTGQPAIFVSLMTTMEGDPIVRTFRVMESGELRIEHDARRDRFGSGQIELLRCERLVGVGDWNAARPDEPVQGEWVFVEDGCEVIGTR